MPSFGPYFCLHSHGYAEQRGVEGLFRYLEEQREQDPLGASIQVARGMVLAARYYYQDSKNRQDPRRPTPSPEDREEAADLVLQAVELRPDSGNLLALAAELLSKVGEHAEAEALVHAAARAQPRSPFVLFQQARLKARQGESKEAVQFLLEAGRPDFNDVEFKFERDPAFAGLLKQPLMRVYLWASRSY